MLRWYIGTLTQMTIVTNTNLLLWVYLTERFLQGSVPLRHRLNVKPPLMSWQRSAFNEVNDRALGVFTVRVMSSKYFTKLSASCKLENMFFKLTFLVHLFIVYLLLNNLALTRVFFTHCFCVTSLGHFRESQNFSAF